MPTHFGPSLGPRQGFGGRRFSCVDSPNDTNIAATFTARKDQLEKFLPPGFTLRAPYSLTFDFSFITNIEWLAGRGYNTFGVSMPVTYQGKEDRVNGDLLLVLWENKADPIITGREDLGFSKIYCEIPEPQLIGENVICRASWDGFEFASLTLSNLADVDSHAVDENAEEVAPSEGGLHYKYIPKTGAPGEADSEYVTLSPADWPHTQIDLSQQASHAALKINAATWEQLPTLVHIVNALAELELGECLHASLVKARGGKDLSDVRVLR